MKSFALQICVLVLTACISFNLQAQSVPADSSTLHYSSVYFEDASLPKAARYDLKLYDNNKSLNADSGTRVLTNTLPFFNGVKVDWAKKYYWRIIAFDKKDVEIKKGSVHLFSVTPAYSSQVYNAAKIDVITNDPQKNAGGYVLLDNLRGIYNRQGIPQWTMPPGREYSGESAEYRDLKFSSANNLTFLSDNRPYEISLEGEVVWKAPQPFIYNNDTIFFHHDIRKTTSGTYLLLGNRTVYRKITNGYESGRHAMVRDYKRDENGLSAKTEVAVVIELNSKNEVVWSWDANNYLTDADLNFKAAIDGFPMLQSHANAVGVNKENTKIYVGFRDLGRIIRIDKATRKVELSLGQKYPSGEARAGDKLFKQQHDASPTDRNTILIFNNNGPRGGFGISNILELRDTMVSNEALVAWQFALDYDTLTRGRSGSGGNVNELPNHNILLCAGQLNRVIEVTREGKVAWDVFTLSRQGTDTTWKPLPNYRCSWKSDIYIPHVLVLDFQKRINKKTINVNFSVVNVNESPDLFSFEIIQERGETIKSVASRTLKPGEQEEVRLKISDRAHTRDKLQLQIRSKTYQTVVKLIDL